MLTRCVEKGREKCDHYWPYDTMPVYYGDISVQILNETRYPDWNVSEFMVCRVSYKSENNVSNYMSVKSSKVSRFSQRQFWGGERLHALQVGSHCSKSVFFVQMQLKLFCYKCLSMYFFLLQGDTQRVMRHFHFTTWPDFGVPNPPHTLVRFVRAFRERVGGDQRPIVVHCR